MHTPHVSEIPTEREPVTPYDTFGNKPAETSMKNSTHFESLANHYDEMYGSAMLNLGRALMQESGQLVLFNEKSPEGLSSHLIASTEVDTSSVPQGPPAEIPEVKTCDHAECSCDAT